MIFEVLELKCEDDGSVVRHTKNGPPIELPAAIKRVGEFSSYIEKGRSDAKTRRLSADMTPSTMGDKAKTHAEVWVEPRGDKRCERFAEVEVNEKIFGVGRIEEKFVHSVEYSQTPDWIGGEQVRDYTFHGDGLLTLEVDLGRWHQALTWRRETR